MDNDGDLDIVVSLLTTGKILLYTNDGAENFSVSQITDEAVRPVDFQVTDFDQDGDLDVISMSSADTKPLWMENQLVDCPRTFNKAMDTICPGDSLAVGGIFIHTAGVYYDTLQNVQSCDSILRLELGMYIVPPLLITFDSTRLFASPGFAGYIWYRNDSLLSGEVGDTLDASLYGSGNYTVIGVAGNGCLVYSDTISLIIVGFIATPEEAEVRVFPNPARDAVNILVPSSYGKIREISVYSVDGVGVDRQFYNTEMEKVGMILRVSHLPRGLWLLHIRTEEIVITKKILKI
jgi:hypothetical protein